MKEIVVPVYVQTELAAAPKPAAEKKPIFAGMSDDELLGYGVPAEWLGDVKKATRTRCWPWPTTCPPRLRRRCWNWRLVASRACPQPARGGGESLRSSRCAAPLPRDDECGGVAACARFPVGEVDRLPAPRAAAMGGARLRRPGARLRFGGHRQDHRRPAPGRPSGAHAS